jgi:hypothetical protein
MRSHFGLAPAADSVFNLGYGRLARATQWRGHNEFLRAAVRPIFPSLNLKPSGRDQCPGVVREKFYSDHYNYR